MVMSNAVKYTIEMPPRGYTSQQMMQWSSEGWDTSKLFVKEIKEDTTIEGVISIDVPENVQAAADTGQFANPTPEQSASCPSGLPADVLQFDQLFQDRDLRIEFGETISRALDARSADSQEFPPEFERIKRFDMAVVDPKTNRVFIGGWYEDHWRLANRSMSNRTPSTYMNAVVINVRDSDVKVFKFTNQHNNALTLEQVTMLQNQGYRVVNDQGEWVMVDQVKGNMYCQSGSLAFKTHLTGLNR
jgi:hypothetical protein